jgi:thiol-disulfide isomerase/thioredoxin
MKVLHINSEEDSKSVDNIIEDKDNHVFVLIYMEGCGPCNATRPEWEKLETALSRQYAKKDKLYVLDINKDFLSNIKKIGNIDGFPTMKYFNEGNVETYEESNIRKKDRTVDSFMEWIESKVSGIKAVVPESTPDNVFKRTSQMMSKKGGMTKRRKQKGGKWSRKYKKSINCKKPKGFSQKQYCKYGRKK